VIVPLAGMLGLLAFRVIPARSDERGMTRFPIPQILPADRPPFLAVSRWRPS
jgi:hypothetical protein